MMQIASQTAPFDRSKREGFSNFELASIFGKTSRYIKKSAILKFMTCSEFEQVLNHCAHLTKFWLFLRVREFCLFVLLTSMILQLRS